jgi:hypothetical protein
VKRSEGRNVRSERTSKEGRDRRKKRAFGGAERVRSESDATEDAEAKRGRRSEAREREGGKRRREAKSEERAGRSEAREGNEEVTEAKRLKGGDEGRRNEASEREKRKRRKRRVCPPLSQRSCPERSRRAPSVKVRGIASRGALGAIRVRNGSTGSEGLPPMTSVTGSSHPPNTGRHRPLLERSTATQLSPARERKLAREERESVASNGWALHIHYGWD